MSEMDLTDVESDSDDIDYEDDRPEKDYDLVVKQEIYIRLRVSARDEDEAQEVGVNALRGMRYNTFVSDYVSSKNYAQTVGITERGQLVREISYDLPERPDIDDVQVEEV